MFTDGLRADATVPGKHGHLPRARGNAAWDGTPQEAADLVTPAIDNCSCALDDRGVRVTMCPAPAMLFSDRVR
jgi:hypothetical protein